MKSKSDFGFNFYYYMRVLNVSGSNKKVKELEIIPEIATRLFLTLWGYSIDEIKEIAKNFEKKSNKKQLDFEVAIDHLAKNIIDNPSEIEKMVVYAAALAFLDGEITEEEKALISILRDQLDLKPSEFEVLLRQGANVAQALHVFDLAHGEDNG